MNQTKISDTIEFKICKRRVTIIFEIAPTEFVFEKFISNITIDSLIRNKIKNKHFRDVFLCPHNALIETSENTIEKTDKCINCGLCDFKYYFLTKKNQNIDFSGISQILNSLPHIAILFNILCSNMLIATEVKAEGNNRDKRIDLVVVNENEIFLIKVLTDSQKLNFYFRSYNDILSGVTIKYPDYDTRLLFLTSDYIARSSQEINNYPFITIEEVIRRKINNGNFTE